MSNEAVMDLAADLSRRMASLAGRVKRTPRGNDGCALSLVAELATSQGVLAHDNLAGEVDV
jgi:hypothetical protein